ncbi:hypothetical protein EHQ92_04325 [Leptospira biflexa]|nr:hypothetical protein EHQ80_08500 [Leptospira biflexa]TGM41640.1 hypothetical protein EHQ89_03065 [Leptospira biflexa]TGM48724.1 hypothetical protein EHQ92_04325 [Leptospira biflexa]TGM51208.1 hypothetical protein EHQ88_08760 [Leptospira biflexa]
MNFFCHRSNFKTYPNTTFVLILLLFLIGTLFSCKKDKGMNHIEWQNESLSLTSDLCKKFRECADTDWKSIPENLKKFTEGRLDEANCQKRFRDSNAYKLIGHDPIEIQTVYKQCHKQVMEMKCSDLQSGKMNTISACVTFQTIQN